MSAVEELLSRVIDSARDVEGPLVIGVAGAQGSGKSYVCRRFAEAHPRVAHFSLDDVYKARAEREAMARNVHPLFITRGPPGTHDLDELDLTFTNLFDAGANDHTPLPRFDKARDDRAPFDQWPAFVGQPDVILFDGWCVGAKASAARGKEHINALDDEDHDGRWRDAVCDAAAHYEDIWRVLFDALIYLQAPSFETVARWRRQQEEENLGRPLTPEDDARLTRFIMHYERITRAMLAGAHNADWIVRLDEDRNVIAIEEHA